MSQFRDQFPQSSPGSVSGGGADAGNITGTPSSRLIAFSPNASSVKSTSKLIQTPDREDTLVFSPTHSSGGGFRPTNMSADKDPFITPSSKAKMKSNQQLSAAASSFRPFYDSLSSNGSVEGNHQVAEGQDLQVSIPGQISNSLSTENFLSRCVEFSCSTQPGAAELNEFIGLAMPSDMFAAANEGQLDMLAVLLHNAPMELSQVEPHVLKLLQAEGDLFAFQKDPRSEEGAVKAIIEYADCTVAMNVASKLNGVIVDGLHIRLSFYQPDGHTGRAAPPNDGVTTPMPTPGRYPPPDNNTASFQGQQGMQSQKMALQHGSNSMVPARHQPTPPTSGIGGPPQQQVALVPMVVRNPYGTTGPIILDPFNAMAGMGPMAGAPIVFPPGTPMSTIVHQGYDGGQRHGPMVRYGNRRGVMRMDRSMQFGPNGHHNQVDVKRIRDGVDVRTTIMLRNIPNKVDQRMLKAIIDESSWGKYDFMYLRIDFANDCNVGYAFINFADPLDIIDFANARDNQRWNCFRSDKIAEISYATIQGRDCLVQKFRNSSVMLESPHYRPKLYYTIGGTNPELAGREEEFPGPDNPSKMKRSCENAEHVGLFTPHLSQYYRDEQRRRRSQFDRGTRMAALEEIDYDASLQRVYVPN
ncbi:hypothetical protein HMPREF1624_02725 [Sporothrix schenckii ATCC 58251]|uniref:RRM domain-containing protein n=1 Tax=Sporothrix schenckii (strain ATCC 58251 / de Perez 2211183) TaxID=1391915 RepID=U7Q456_SPOS1|nr:hypothetical protein HMPREF1624_02725 [Sporothrix schenckii ATCC 58251]